jgi:hypothetical protein
MESKTPTFADLCLMALRGIDKKEKAAAEAKQRGQKAAVV